MKTTTLPCPKVPHVNPSGGYLHDESDDSPYSVDGLLYCGRCHYACDQNGRCDNPRVMACVCKHSRADHEPHGWCVALKGIVTMCPCRSFRAIDVERTLALRKRRMACDACEGTGNGQIHGVDDYCGKCDATGWVDA